MSLKYGIHAYNSKKYGPIIQGFEIIANDKEDKTRKFLTSEEHEKFLTQAKNGVHSWYNKQSKRGQLILCPDDKGYDYWLEKINSNR